MLELFNKKQPISTVGRVTGAGCLDQAGDALLWSWKVEDFANLGILLL